ncbi:molybdate ABC transporter substrate-binding protein [Diaminobutyricibacter sp. McL0608]|uniref:molybdate ABC transporter substrate-binding protein n=1 Tax=Leifsonia sp. McL0608 TaxID=3143537 RepID=UPI0031F32DEA
MRTVIGAVSLAGALAVGVTACSGSAGTTPTPAASTSELSGSITVFAAASLTKTFTEIGDDFQKANPGATVTFSFAGSSDLVSQIKEGAPASVFASADEANMKKVIDAGLASGTPVDFATNVLAIAVPPGNPAKITGWNDLAKPGVKVVVCAPQVPCGAATVKVEQSTGVTLHPVSEESSVTDVLGKVSSGEADAGIVYVTDVTGAGSSVESVPFPEAAGVVNTYPIAVLKGSPNGKVADAFVEYVTGPEGQKVLNAAGFGKP